MLQAHSARLGLALSALLAACDPSRPALSTAENDVDAPPRGRAPPPAGAASLVTTSGPDPDAAVPDGATPDDAAGPSVPDEPLLLDDTRGAAVAYQITPAHDGAQLGGAFSPPFNEKWARELGVAVSYPLIAGGRVFVLAGTASGTELWALDGASGEPLWGPLPVGSRFRWAAAAYDAGRVYALDDTGLLLAFAAADGSTLWSQQLSGPTLFTSPPTAAGGMVFAAGVGLGGTLYGIDGSSGATLWAQPYSGVGGSAPAVSSTAVYVAGACGEAEAFSPRTGRRLWRHMGACTSGAGATPALSSDGGTLYLPAAAGGRILATALGQDLGPLVSDRTPALDTLARSPGTVGLYVQGQAIHGVDVVTGVPWWTQTLDGALSPAVTADGYAYVASSAGTLYALDSRTGSILDTAPLGAGFVVDQGVNGPPAGLALGGSMLVVASGKRLVAY